jgi:CheY-like chemotaxis protein
VSEAIQKILVMDDEEIVSNIAKQMLLYLGFEVSIATEGAEAVRLYRQAYEEGAAYLAIIMDLNIPRGMGGIEALAEVLKIDADAKVLVSSGYACDSIMDEYGQYGFCGCIAKPYDMHDLQNAINAVLQGKKETRSPGRD